MSTDTKKRLALITGANGGIGRATVDLFHQNGWRVLAVDITDINEEPPEDVLFYRTDIAKPELIKQLANDVQEISAGELDALVNNAAIQTAKPLIETSPEDWDAVMDVNLRAPFLLTKAVYPLLKQARGAVVNVSSVHAHKTSPDMGSYATSKGGLLGLTQSMALEFASDGVRVNAVLPGATQTEMLMKSMTREGLEGRGAEERMSVLGEKMPLKRILHPDEIAHVIYFLSDEKQASSITGIQLIADGGALALGSN